MIRKLNRIGLTEFNCRYHTYLFVTSTFAQYRAKNDYYAIRKIVQANIVQRVKILLFPFNVMDGAVGGQNGDGDGQHRQENVEGDLRPRNALFDGSSGSLLRHAGQKQVLRQGKESIFMNRRAETLCSPSQHLFQ